MKFQRINLTIACIAAFSVVADGANPHRVQQLGATNRSSKAVHAIAYQNLNQQADLFENPFNDDLPPGVGIPAPVPAPAPVPMDPAQVVAPPQAAQAISPMPATEYVNPGPEMAPIYSSPAPMAAPAYDAGATIYGSGTAMPSMAMPAYGAAPAPSCGVPAPSCGVADPTCGMAGCCQADPCGTCDAGGGCAGGCGLGLCDCDLGDAFTLNGLLFGDCPSCVTVGGWLSAGYHSEGNDLFNNRPEEFSLHQAWLYLERVATAENPLGFRADFMYGIDAGDTQAFGNPSGSWDFDNGFDHGAYGWAIPQLYAELAVGDWSIKAGHFYTLIGYEVVTAPDNFFYSHAITMFNSEPFTHTGVLKSRPLDPI